MECKFAINMDNGLIAPYVSGVSNKLFNPIPDDIALAVSKGKMEWKTVVNAINKKRFANENFDWTELAKAKDEINIRKTKFELKDETEKSEVEDTKKSDTVTMDELMSGEDGSKSDKKTRSKPSKPVSDSNKNDTTETESIEEIDA